MRHTEFWERLEHALGPARARSWSQMVVLRELDGRTVQEALAAGLAPKRVWAAVWRELELPEGDK